MSLRRHCPGTLVAALLAAAAAMAPAAHADTVASLLGNFTINQFSAVSLADTAVNVHRVIVFGQLPALRELHAADADGDGVTTQPERDAYATRVARSLADSLELNVDGARVPLHFVRAATSLPVEQGGFSLRLDLDFSAPLASDRQAAHRLAFANRNYDGRFGWNEIVVTPSPTWHVYDTDAFANSLTGGLTEALQALPAAGPLQERAVHLAISAGAPPAGAVPLGARPGTSLAAPASGVANATAAAAAPEEDGLQARTQRLVALISERDAPWTVTLLALVTAFVLGAFHAFSPGHGKTVVGAYLIGSRATARHAVFLGTTVTITHSIGVFALGFATLFAAHYIVPETLIPLLSLVSGALVLGMGIALLLQRWPRRGAPTPGAAPASPRTMPLAGARLRSATARRDPRASAGYLVARMQGHATPALAHAHGDGGHSHGGGGHAHGDDEHSHGGRWHSHAPPASVRDAVSWRGLLALGVSGGLVPCPSAMVLLLAAVALNRTAFGLVLVLAFSLGLAMTLIAVGLAFLYARHRLPNGFAGGRIVRWLPALSATAITGIGVALCYVAAMSML